MYHACVFDHNNWIHTNLQKQQQESEAAEARLKQWLMTTNLNIMIIGTKNYHIYIYIYIYRPMHNKKNRSMMSMGISGQAARIICMYNLCMLKGVVST